MNRAPVLSGGSGTLGTASGGVNRSPYDWEPSVTSQQQTVANDQLPSDDVFTGLKVLSFFFLVVQYFGFSRAGCSNLHLGLLWNYVVHCRQIPQRKSVNLPTKPFSRL